MRTGVEGCGVVVWFGKCTRIASLVLLFGFTTPAYKRNETKRKTEKEREKAWALDCEGVFSLVVCGRDGGCNVFGPSLHVMSCHIMSYHVMS